MEDKRVCVVCPVCGAVDEYEIDEMYGLEPLDETHAIDTYVGECSNCQTELMWEQVYELIRVQNVRKVNP